MVKLAHNPKSFHPLGLGCWIYQPELWDASRQQGLIDTMQTALERGINHFDTATGYGEGQSEMLIGRVLPGRREQVFLASKANFKDENPLSMLTYVQKSLKRLQTDYIDLYYIHWPRPGLDLRPMMEGLEMARRQGLIRSLGVSNFSVPDLEQASQAGSIDAHQIPHSLLWRYPERDVIPYCMERGIPVITYGTLGYGILTGKFSLQPHFPASDQRNIILFFQPQVWGAVHAAVEQMKQVAAQVGRPLAHLVIAWSLSQPGIGCALVGANSPAQASENAAALEGHIPTWALEELSQISSGLLKSIPDLANPYELPA